MENQIEFYQNLQNISHTILLASILGFLISICILFFQIVWMIQMRRIARANTEYTIMQLRIMKEYFKSKGIEIDLQKINDETAKQIIEGRDFNGVSDSGFKL